MFGEVGQFVEEGGVVLGFGAVLQVGELVFGGGPLVVPLAVALADAGAVGGGCRAGVGAEFFEFGEQAGLCGVDAGEFFAQRRYAGLAGGVRGAGFGDCGDEAGGAVGAEYVLGQESGDGGRS